MSFSPSRRARASSPRNRRPLLEALEDRTLPSGNPIGVVPHPAAQLSDTATQLEVILPRSAEVGVPVTVKVIALDASNHRVFDYGGTVHFTSSDGSALLPADSTLNDFGKDFFQVTFETAGSESVTATDTQTATITGTASTTVLAAPVATHLFVVAPRNVIVGVPEPVLVEALDASNHRVPNYSGTVTLSTGKSADMLPGPYQFQASDHGKHVFLVTFGTAGTETLTATDNSKPPLMGSVSVTVAAPGVVTHFGVFAIPFAIAGHPTEVLVAALDANNHPVPNYAGTVHFTSSDGGATLPGDYMFQSSDMGLHLFSVTFATNGKQTITATDTSSSAISGTATVHVITFVFPPIPFFSFGGLGQGQFQGIFNSGLASLSHLLSGFGQLQTQFQSLAGQLQGQFQSLVGQLQSQSQSQSQSHSQSQSQSGLLGGLGSQLQSIFKSLGGAFGFHF
jgi:hypothetical protein